jgi:hypothetical protein
VLAQALGLLLPQRPARREFGPAAEQPSLEVVPA